MMSVDEFVDVYEIITQWSASKLCKLFAQFTFYDCFCHDLINYLRQVNELNWQLLSISSYASVWVCAQQSDQSDG